MWKFIFILWVILLGHFQTNAQDYVPTWDYLTFRLPHMGAEFFVSPKEFVQYGGDSPDEGVAPDSYMEDDHFGMPEMMEKLKLNNATSM